MSISRTQRSFSWNVAVWSRSFCVAGVYQREGMLLVQDIAHELELCLLFDKPDAALWQPALLPRDTTRNGLVILDQQDNNSCIELAGLPKRPVDPRYLGIGEVPNDERYLRFKVRSPSCTSSRTTSPSPSRTDISDTEISPSFL
ncbi:hypothetical protein VM1G_08961 [Cytospora mali]|uniref:Uncharacterized protein n=1 Tax=Cytospora mali TaxID=578113 RepID=A0A194W9M8_CYTMA|nr:hypothetical protein VM1G_08961 [Valsa mali]